MTGDRTTENGGSRVPDVAGRVVLGLTVLLLAAGCSGNGEDPLGMAGQVGGLGDEVSFEAYRIRPPRNLPRREIPSPSPSIKVTAWAEASLEDRVSPSVLMVCAPNSADLTTTPPMWQQGAANGLRSFHRMFDRVKQVAGNRLQVNGLEAYRAEFTAETPKGDPVSGIVLIIIDDKNILACIALGIGENAGSAVAALEESLMTIKRPGYVPPKNALWDTPPGANPGAPLPGRHVEMIKTHGLDKIAVISTPGLPYNRTSVVQSALHKAIPGSLTLGTSVKGETVVLVSPVEDVAALAEKLDLGQVKMIDEKNRTFTLRVDEDKIPAMEQQPAEQTGFDMNAHAAFPEPKKPVTSDPNDPEFFKQNLDAMQAGDVFEREKALKRLASADTGKLNDPEIRKQIAQAFRALAFDDTLAPDDRRVAIRGLVHWGGKFAGPILVQLLQQEPDFVTDEIYRQLAILKEPSAIDLLAKKLMEPGHDRAADCLIQYGSVAEDSVLANTRATNFIITGKVVRVLAQIGTKKSLPALKSLRKLTFYNMIAGDVLQAIQMIEKREKERSQSAPTPESLPQTPEP